MGRISLAPTIGCFQPTSPVVVSCQGEEGGPNLITVGAVTITCRQPPMTGIAIDLVRYSHKLITESQEYCINLASAEQARELDYCGIVSGRDGDKFEAAGLSPEPSLKIRAPSVREFPVSIECVVRDTLHLGSHDWFSGEIVAVTVDPAFVDKGGRLDMSKFKPIAGCFGAYRRMGEAVGRYGFAAKP